MSDLTPQQIVLLAAKSKLTRPTIFDSDLQIRESISKETEDALILLSPEKRNQASQYVKAFADKEDRADEVSKVLQLFSDQQKDNAEDCAVEIGVAFQKFQEFKSSLFGTGNDLFVRGLSPLLKALNVGLGKLKHQHDRYNYDQLHLVAANSNAQPNLTLSQKKELLSWVAVLVSYS